MILLDILFQIHGINRDLDPMFFFNKILGHGKILSLEICTNLLQQGHVLIGDKTCFTIDLPFLFHFDQYVILDLKKLSIRIKSSVKVCYRGNRKAAKITLYQLLECNTLNSDPFSKSLDTDLKAGLTNFILQFFENILKCFGIITFFTMEKLDYRGKSLHSLKCA